jgi:hypothetical protein
MNGWLHSNPYSGAECRPDIARWCPGVISGASARNVGRPRGNGAQDQAGDTRSHLRHTSQVPPIRRAVAADRGIFHPGVGTATSIAGALSGKSTSAKRCFLVNQIGMV